MFPKFYFDLFKEEIDESKVFVGMPFKETKFKSRWKDVIEPGIREAGFEPFRVDEEIINDSIIMKILKGINTSKILLFDISKEEKGSRNGNIMYELGLAHARRAPNAIIALRDDDDRLLFDIAQCRVIKYSSGSESDIMNEVCSLVKDVVRTIDMTKEKIVKETIRLLDVSSLEMIRTSIEDTIRVHRHSTKIHSGSIPPEDFRPTIRRLLELGLIKYDKEVNDSALYSLTNLGKIVKECIKT